LRGLGELVDAAADGARKILLLTDGLANAGIYSVSSRGELAIALAASFPAERIHLHGNNKTAQELSEAVAAGEAPFAACGRIYVGPHQPTHSTSVGKVFRR